MKLVFSFLVFLILSNSLVLAGGWTQKKGSGFYQLSYRYLSGENIYNDEGEKIPFPVKDHTIGLYGEYGLTNNLTLTALFLPYKKISLDEEALSGIIPSGTSAESSEKSGIGDSEIGLRYLLKKFGNSVLSGALKLGFPSGETDPNSLIWLGTGEFSQLIGLELGHSFYPAAAYFTASFSYRNRTEGFSDEIKYGISAGYSFSKRLAVSGKFHGLNPLDNGEESVSGGLAIYSNRQRYIAYGLDITFKIHQNVSLFAGYESGGNGRNIISAPVISAGVNITH